MSDLFKSFLDGIQASQQGGWSGAFALWMFVMVTLAAALLALRAYRTANDARLHALSERLDKCEQKHEDERERRARIQRKLSMVTGLLISQLGNRALPDGFLQIILNDDIEEVPRLAPAVAS